MTPQTLARLIQEKLPSEELVTRLVMETPMTRAEIRQFFEKDLNDPATWPTLIMFADLRDISCRLFELQESTDLDKLLHEQFKNKSRFRTSMTPNRIRSLKSTILAARRERLGIQDIDKDMEEMPDTKSQQSSRPAQKQIQERPQHGPVAENKPAASAPEENTESAPDAPVIAADPGMIRIWKALHPDGTIERCQKDTKIPWSLLERWWKLDDN